MGVLLGAVKVQFPGLTSTSLSGIFVFMQFKPINKCHGYFIAKEGYVFKTENAKDVRIPAVQSPKSKDVYVSVRGKNMNLLHIVLEHFHPEIKYNDKIKFRITYDLRIPADSVKLIALKLDLDPEDEARLYKYSCDRKCHSANARSKDKLTAIQVYTTLKIHQFKCVYCGCTILCKNWHLDHFVSLHKGGTNRFENIVPSCPECNLMKGPLEGFEFYNRCSRIAANFMFSDSQNAKNKYSNN